MRVRIVLGVVAALVLGLGWSGSASAEKKRVGVPKFDGPQEAIVRRSVMQVLKGHGYDVVGPRELSGAQLDSNDGFRAAAKELAISAYVTGEVSKKKAKLTVRNGSDGAVAGEGSFGGANPKKIGADVRDGFWRRLGSAVERGRAPSGAKKPAAAPVAEPEEADEKDETADADEAPSKPSKAAGKSESEEAPPAGKSEAAPEETVAKKAPSEPGEEGVMGPRALDIGVGIGGFSRNLSYNQDLYGQLRQYKLALGPALSLSVLAFPAAFATSSFVANIGLELNVEYALGVTSSVPANAMGPFPNGATFGTQIHDYNGGVRVRFVLPGGHELAALAGGGEHAFSFRSGGDGDRTMLNIPDTIYRYLRVGVVTRFELPSGVTAGLGAAFRYVLNKGGQISDPGFFPFLKVSGLDVNAMLGYHVTPSIEARFNVNLRRYFYAMNSDPTDLKANPPNSVAGGAVDQYVGFTIGAAYVFGGVTGGASGEEPEEAAPETKKKHKKKKSDDEDGEGDAGEAKGGGSSDE